MNLFVFNARTFSSAFWCCTKFWHFSNQKIARDFFWQQSYDVVCNRSVHILLSRFYPAFTWFYPNFIQIKPDFILIFEKNLDEILIKFGISWKEHFLHIFLKPKLTIQILSRFYPDLSWFYLDKIKIKSE